MSLSRHNLISRKFSMRGSVILQNHQSVNKKNETTFYVRKMFVDPVDLMLVDFLLPEGSGRSHRAVIIPVVALVAERLLSFDRN